MSTKRVLVVLSIIVCGAGMAMGQTEWVDDPANPVIGPGDAGPWDVGGPWARAVVFDGSTYHLYFTGSASNGFPNDMGHATSTDGETWIMNSANPVLTRGESGSWDDTRIDGAAVVHDGTLFHMWYSAMDSTYNERAGYATSPDGTIWTKHADNPVMDVGPPGSWNDDSIRPTTVMIDDGEYRMWFGGAHCSTTQCTYAVGYAESNDGITWSKLADPVLSPSTFPGAWDPGMVANPYIEFDGSNYHMWYSGGIESGSRVDLSIGYAWSGDGINWTKHRGNPVITSEEAIFWHSPVLLIGSTWHMWYTSSSDLITSQIEHATSDGGIGVPPLDNWSFIPAAAVASGAEGAFFQTDVDVNNADDQAVDYQFQWLPRGENNPEPTNSETFSLGAGKSTRYANVLAEVFDLEPDAFGALVIISTSPDLLAMSRTYNIGVEDAGGTYGQAIPAITQGDFIQQGETRRILFGSEDADLRTNIGCQNGWTNTVAIFMELFDSDGTSLDRPFMFLGALGNDQVNRIFDGHNPVDGYVEISSPSPDASYYCYGSVLDNTTSDPTTIPPQ